jgi:ribosomal protein L37E
VALIKCKECGKEISDQADACPHCGFSFGKERNEEETKEKNDRHASLPGPRIRLLGILFLATWALIAICSIGWLIYTKFIDNTGGHFGTGLLIIFTTALGVFGLLVVIGTAMFVRGSLVGRAWLTLLLPLHIAAGCYITFDLIRDWDWIRWDWGIMKPHTFEDVVGILLSALFTLMGMALMFAVLTAGRGVGRDR